MPVLPLVASTIVVRPGSIRPSRSAASIIATPIRSLTLPPGLNDSSLANSCAPPSGASRLSSTIGVLPTWAAMLVGIGDIPSPTVRGLARDGLLRLATAWCEQPDDAAAGLRAHAPYR